VLNEAGNGGGGIGSCDEVLLQAASKIITEQYVQRDGSNFSMIVISVE